MMVQRTLSARILGLAAKYPVVTITGPRQSGKTTLARTAFDGYDYVSLEEPDTRSFARTDPRGFLATYPGRTIIDEVQQVPELLSYLQTRVDESAKTGQYILTGSQHFALSEQISQSLAGRTAVCTLLPFSIGELHSADLLPLDLDAFMLNGCYPRLYDQAMTADEFFPSYISTYVERDVRTLRNIEDLGLFERFVKLCAGRVGQLLNMSSLANECGISHTTVEKWISLLQTSYIAYLLRPHHRNFGKRIVKTPKLYFYDVGLACSLLEIHSPRALATYHNRGSLFECAMVSELLKVRFNQALPPNLYFWRDKTGHEVDCLMENADELLPIECKSGRTLTEDSFRGLDFYRALSAHTNAALIYGGDTDQQRTHVKVLGWRHVGDAAAAQGLPGGRPHWENSCRRP